jgi:hypothetical protein
MHNHKGEECPVHGKKECPSTEIEEGKYSSGSVTYIKGTAPVRDPQTGESYPKETYKKKAKIQKEEVEIIDEATYPSDFKKGSPVATKKKGRPNAQGPESGKKEIDEAKKCWKGYKKAGTQKLFGKTYNRCVKAHFSDWRADLELQEGAAWTKKSGKNEKGGLNEKGRKSYERENPGSDLKRPSKKVGNKRRASFCARMKGMKKKLTSKKTANDPDSRINKSLRAWNC